MSDGWVLMYHRVCERGPDTQCWFERGTAVTPAALERQLAWLCERFTVVPLEALHAPARVTERPRIALTFDDGYADTLELAAPICARFAVTATCFACAGPARGGPALWFDTWYAIVHAGLASGHWNATLRRRGLPAATDLTACVSGNAKHWLAALPPDTRDPLLQELAAELGAIPPRYLDLDGLRALRRLGWNIGGHGVHHAQLADCDDLTLAAELHASLHLLADLDASGARCFAYPNGSFSERVVRAVAMAGFDFACTVERAPWIDPSAPFTIPRLFCRGEEPIPHPLLVTSATR